MNEKSQIESDVQVLGRPANDLRQWGQEAFPIRVALVGMGRMGQLYSGSWGNYGEIVGILDASETATQKAASKGYRSFQNLAEMLEVANPQLVCICTPPATHAEVASICLAKPGLHVLCEKPLVTRLEDAKAMIQSRLQMATKFRYFGAILELQKLLAERALGKLTGFRIEFVSRVDHQGTWFCDPSVSGGGVVMDNAPHALDLVRFLFGSIQRLEAFGERHQGVEFTGLLALRTQGGLSGTVQLSWETPSWSDSFLTVQGTEGSVEIGWKGGQWRRGDSVTPIGGAWDKVAIHKAMMKSVAEWVVGESAPGISNEEIFHNVVWTDAANRALGQNA